MKLLAVFAASAILVTGIADLVLAQAPGDPNHTDGKTTGKQAIRDESVWKNKPNLPQVGGGSPVGPSSPAPPSAPSAPARPCPQYPSTNSVPNSLGGSPVQRGATADALNGAISVEGDQQFQDMILCDMDRIQGSPDVGSSFLSALAGELNKRSAQVKIRNKSFFSSGPHTQPGDGGANAWVMASDPALTRIYRSEPKKIPFTSTYLILESPLDPSTQPGPRGQGTGAVVYIDPTQFPLPAITSSHLTPGHVALFHELVHAWHYAIGKGNLSPYVNSAGSVDPTWVSVEEFDTIPASNWQFTENAYRRSLQMSDRTCVSASCF